MIDGSGQSRVCNGTGQAFPKFKPMLTGYASFNQRNEFLATQLSQNNNDGKITDVLLSPQKSLQFLREPPKNSYLPALNKFEGYVQFRCPLTKSRADDPLRESLKLVDRSKQTSSVPRESLNSSQAPNSSRFKTLPIIVDNPQNEDVLEYLKQPNPAGVKSTKGQKKQIFLDRKNLNALYNSYKPSLRPTDYFHQTRKTNFVSDQQSKVLEAYADYLSKASGKRVYKSSPNTSQLNDTKGSSATDIIKESAKNLINDRKVESQAPRKIVEISLKIIKYQDKEKELREPPI